MIQIERYGLQWTVDASNPNKVVLKQGNGFTFWGKLLMHPVWGPYIYIHSVCGFVNTNNVYEKKEYLLLAYQWFFVPELESMCNTKQTRWYHALHETHEKSMFRQSEDTWFVLMRDLLGEKQVYYDDVFDMFFPMFNWTILRLDNVKTSSNTYHSDVALFIDNNIYEQLPEQWTIDDIYNADKEYQDEFRQISEQLWYNIAEARQSGQPIVIFVEEECLSIGSIRCIYTEQKTPYGMTLPIIIPYKEGRGYI